MPWKEYEFKGQTVYVRVLPTGKPIVHRGRVELRYKLGATKSYRASPDNIVDKADAEIVSDEDMGGSARPAATTALRETPKQPADENTIVIYTDGACSGNPGPAGIGVFFQRPSETVEISEFLGSGTNNIAELTAILRALETLTEDEYESVIHLYTDSGWSLGVLIGGWKAKTNLELIGQIKEKLDKLPKLELLKVKGHAGQEGNEEADHLATMAVRRESSLTRTASATELELMPDVIEVRRDAAVVAVVQLNQDVIKLGRLSSSHVRLEDSAVSRMHAVLERHGNGWSVIDLGSSEGTYVDGERINKAQLRPDSVIGIGPFEVRVNSPTTGATPGPPVPMQTPATPEAASPTRPFRCPSCGHSGRAASGRVRTAFMADDGLDSDRPDALTTLRADVCAACGHLALFADPAAFLS